LLEVLGALLDATDQLAQLGRQVRVQQEPEADLDRQEEVAQIMAQTGR
jgi:hypothetical protein